MFRYRLYDCFSTDMKRGLMTKTCKNEAFIEILPFPKPTNPNPPNTGIYKKGRTKTLRPGGYRS